MFYKVQGPNPLSQTPLNAHMVDLIDEKQFEYIQEACTFIGENSLRNHGITFTKKKP